jgi:hypothetical protein
VSARLPRPLAMSLGVDFTVDEAEAETVGASR